jgi:hypothetical protein
VDLGVVYQRAALDEEEGSRVVPGMAADILVVEGTRVGPVAAGTARELAGFLVEVVEKRRFASREIRPFCKNLIFQTLKKAYQKQTINLRLGQH